MQAKVNQMSSELCIEPAGLRAFSVRALRAAKFLGTLAFLLASSGVAQAFEDLTPAQNLVYGTAHLSNTVA